jgi:hypothetical protein
LAELVVRDHYRRLTNVSAEKRCQSTGVQAATFGLSMAVMVRRINSSSIRPNHESSLLERGVSYDFAMNLVP